MADYNSSMESGSSAEETSSSDLHPLTNIGDASIWESWTGHASSGDELTTANSTAELGCSSRLTFQQSDSLSGWLSGFSPMSQAASGICQNAADAADPPTLSFISDGQVLAMCNSSPDPDQYCDMGFEFGDQCRYIRTGVTKHHPESHYYTPACDEGLSSESYSNSRDDKSVYAKPLVAPLTALQLLQSLDPESPSSPLSQVYNNNSPLPSFGNWDGGHLVSTWVDCPPTSQPLAGTTLQLMHAEHSTGSQQYIAELQASKRELFRGTDTSADPYYTIYHPGGRTICDHPVSMVNGQFDPLIQRSGTRLLCNSEILTGTCVSFSTPASGWATFSEDMQLDSSSSRSMEVLPAFSEAEQRTGSLCFSQDFQVAQEERASSVGTTVSANVHTSSSGEIVDPARYLQDQRPGKHRLELVEIDCDDEASPPPKRNAYESSSAARQRIQNPRGLEPKSNASNTSSSHQFEVMDMIAVGPALNTNGKPRARRGSATDPQSIYARHRRNKINERLKTLQHLVPNGAKVDIVTMLEAAIDYVKYLQDQVKLLKMEQWMSATPTIYNGVDISAI